MKKRLEMEPGSGNVFADLGLPDVLAGQFRGYPVERLMRFLAGIVAGLAALGHDVEMVVKPRKSGAAELWVA